MKLVFALLLSVNSFLGVAQTERKIIRTELENLSKQGFDSIVVFSWHCLGCKHTTSNIYMSYDSSGLVKTKFILVKTGVDSSVIVSDSIFECRSCIPFVNSFRKNLSVLIEQLRDIDYVIAEKKYQGKTVQFSMGQTSGPSYHLSVFIRDKWYISEVASFRNIDYAFETASEYWTLLQLLKNQFIRIPWKSENSD